MHVVGRTERRGDRREEMREKKPICRQNNAAGRPRRAHPWPRRSLHPALEAGRNLHRGHRRGDEGRAEPHVLRRVREALMLELGLGLLELELVVLLPSDACLYVCVVRCEGPLRENGLYFRFVAGFLNQ